jgi:hypothetical protein
MPCSTVSSLASSTRSSAYFTVRITYPPILKSPNPPRACLVSYSLYKLNRMGDKQQPCLTPLPIFTLLVSPWSSRILTFCSMYNLLINLLSHQSIPVPFRICINLVQLTRPNDFCQAMKQGHKIALLAFINGHTCAGIWDFLRSLVATYFCHLSFQGSVLCSKRKLTWQRVQISRQLNKLNEVRVWFS